MDKDSKHKVNDSENHDKDSESKEESSREVMKSAWEIAQERAEALLKRSDEELEAEDQMRGKSKKISHETEKQKAGSADAEKAAEYLDHLQRLQAEFNNYRRRVEKEKTEFVKFANSELVGKMTEVLDDFERGLAEEHHKEVPDAFLQGIEGVYRKFKEILSRQGLEKVPTVGEVFNPEIHEAILQEPSEEFDPGTISAEIRPGYFLGERLLRPPLVKVASAPAREVKEQEAE